MLDLTPVEPFIRDGYVPGAAVTVYRDGGFETACLGKKSDTESLTEESRFPLGCLLKLLVSQVALDFVQAGMVLLDEPLSTYLPELENTILTLRNLLNHSAGFMEPQGKHVRWSLDWNQVVRAVQAGSMFVPGSAFSYTQSGYSIICVLLERLSGKALGEILNEHICAVIGLASFPPDLIHVPRADDACLYVRHSTTDRLMPFRLPRDVGLMRYAMGSITLSSMDLAQIGKYILERSASDTGGSTVFECCVALGPVVGQMGVEDTPTHWGLGVSHHGPLTGNTGSYFASTSALYLDRKTFTVLACSMNTWSPVARQILAYHVAAQLGQPHAPSHSSRINTGFRVSDIVGSYDPLMYGMPSLQVAADGLCTGALQGRLVDFDGGIELVAGMPGGTLGVEEHPQTGAPLLRSGLSLYLRN